MSNVVTVNHPSGKTEVGVVSNDRSGTGTQVVIGNKSYSYPTGKGSSISVVHDNGASANNKRR